MKNTINYLFFLIVIIPAGIFTASAQNRKAEDVKKIVESKNYIFKAENVLPLAGRTRQLTSDYDLTITGDSVIAYLPYFGRAYSAPTDPSEGGIKFTSTRSDYTIVKKIHSWEVTIKPKDASDVQQLCLDIFDNGSASLRINSTNRQSISYNGYIKEGRPGSKRAF